MSIDHLLIRPVTIHRVNVASSIDEYGNEVPGDIELVETTGYLETTDVHEVLVGQQTYQADWNIVLKAHTPLDAWDRIEVPDVQIGEAGSTHAAMFEVVGQPYRPHRPWTDQEMHVEADLRIYTA